MVSPVLYSPSTGRRYSRPFPPAYLGYPERRPHSSPHDSRVIIMAEQQLESDPAPQRKRIAVAVSMTHDSSCAPNYLIPPPPFVQLSTHYTCQAMNECQYQRHPFGFPLSPRTSTISRERSYK